MSNLLDHWSNRWTYFRRGHIFRRLRHISDTSLKYFNLCFFYNNASLSIQHNIKMYYETMLHKTANDRKKLIGLRRHRKFLRLILVFCISNLHQFRMSGSLDVKVKFGQILDKNKSNWIGIGHCKIEKEKVKQERQTKAPIPWFNK